MYHPSAPPLEQVPNEFLLGAGEYRVWADHVRMDPDGVGTMNVTAGAVPDRVVPGGGSTPELVERQLRAFDEKVRRYVAVLTDPGNPIRRLTIPARDTEVGRVLLARATALAGPGVDIRVCPRSGCGAFKELHLGCADFRSPLPLDRVTLLDAAARRWGDGFSIARRPMTDVDLRLAVDCAQPWFQIVLCGGHDFLTLDGTREQNLATAAWLRTLMPARSRIVVFGPASGATVPLAAGVEPDTLATLIAGTAPE